MADNSDNRPVRLLEIAKVFLTIGCIGFGGGIAVIAMVQDYCVNRRRWIDLDEFSHGMAFGQILGPVAVNAAIFVGYRLRGLKGAIVATTSILTPSLVLVMALTEVYLRYKHIPSLQAALTGLGPVVVALIVAAAYQIGQETIRRPEPVILLALSILLVGPLEAPVISVLLGAAAYGLLKVVFQRGGARQND